MTDCADRLEGPHVAVRLGDDLPGPFLCTRPRRHPGAHMMTGPLMAYRVWWWRWGNDRIQMRAKVVGERGVRS